MKLSSNYFIKDGYQPNTRVEYFDDTPFKDEWQDEVYSAARVLADEHGCKTVIDYGCGSAFKLLKHFSDFRTLGIDLLRTVRWLEEKYPARQWTELQQPLPCDLLIAADVIEHLPDPDCLLDFISACRPKIAVISTPNRDLSTDPRCQSGPTGPHHAREWNFEEFALYIGSRFPIHQHYISNLKQATQVVVLKEPR